MTIMTTKRKRFSRHILFLAAVFSAGCQSEGPTDSSGDKADHGTIVGEDPEHTESDFAKLVPRVVEELQNSEPIAVSLNQQITFSVKAGRLGENDPMGAARSPLLILEPFEDEAGFYTKGNRLDSGVVFGFTLNSYDPNADSEVDSEGYWGKNLNPPDINGFWTHLHFRDGDIIGRWAVVHNDGTIEKMEDEVIEQAYTPGETGFRVLATPLVVDVDPDEANLLEDSRDYSVTANLFRVQEEGE